MISILPKEILELNKIFRDANYDLYVVGGAVRDFKKGIKPKDFDVVTNAKPDEVIKILIDKFEIKDNVLGNGWRINEQGKSFAVIVLYIKGIAFEIASFNTRNNGKISLDASILDDSKRRDLTINALYFDIAKNKIIDLVGGLHDIQNNIIRMVGDPNKRIIEDPLRIQRIFRFSIRFNSIIDKDTVDAIQNNKHLYREISDERPNGISQERINMEFESSFKSDFKKYTDLINKFDMWDILYPNSNVDTENIIIYDNFVLTMVIILINSKDFTKYSLSSEFNNLFKLFSNINENISEIECIKLRKMQIRQSIPDDFILALIKNKKIKNPNISKMLRFNPNQLNISEIAISNGLPFENGKLLNKRDGKKLGEIKTKEELKLFKNL